MKMPASVSSPSVPTLTWAGGERGCTAGLAAPTLGAAAGVLMGPERAVLGGAALPAPPAGEGSAVGWVQATRPSTSSAARLENHPCIDHLSVHRESREASASSP